MGEGRQGSKGIGLAVEELKHLAGDERCFVVGGDHGARSWGAHLRLVPGQLGLLPRLWLATIQAPSVLHRGGTSFSPTLKMPTIITVLSKSYPTTQKQDY